MHVERVDIAFVCSNDTQAVMFSSVIHTLREEAGLSSEVIPLDAAYGQAAAEAAVALRLPVTKLQLLGLARPYGTFYNRPVPFIWADVIRARKSASTWLARTEPKVLVVGNDNGLVEKVFLHLAAGNGIPRVLVQDGRLSESRERISSVRARLLRFAKRALSPALTSMGLPYLASSEYGRGEVTHICASGPHGASILSRRARSGVLVTITGQPRYDSLPRDEWGSKESRRVVYFTTPFRTERVGGSSQVRQDRFLRDLAVALVRENWRLVVKPHPREPASHYQTLLGSSAEISGETPEALLSEATAALVGVSTLVEEAAIVGCPVFVPGQTIHEGRFEMSLPDQRVYPRVESADQVLTILRQLATTRAALINRQRQQVASEIDIAPGATFRVSEVIRGAHRLAAVERRLSPQSNLA